jgi:alkanesulfonate monooxygenase SsuD/methylene tetrahydromethanopterin reductase-like flavin-dependent oxidoreductase (luciferase family)
VPRFSGPGSVTELNGGAVKFDLYYEMMASDDWTDESEQRLYSQVLDQVAFADEMGFSTIWFVRHHARAGYAHSPTPEVVFGALSQRTERIRFGFGVEVLPYHHPMYVAERVAVVDVLSGGRVECGTGRGSGAELAGEILGIPAEEAKPRWLESVKLLPELWTKRDVVHQGEFWSWDRPQTVVPHPAQKPHPPLWSAASSPESVVDTGKYQLGLLTSGYTALGEIAKNVDAYRAAFAASEEPIGYVPNDRVAAATTWLCHEPGDVATAERLRTAVLGWARRDITRGHGRRSLKATEVQLGKSRSEMTDDELLNNETGLVRVGDPEYFLEATRRYSDAGVDHLMLQMQLSNLSHEDTMRSIELFGRHIIPAGSEVGRDAVAV